MPQQWPLLPASAIGPGCDPEPGSAHWCRDADKENWIVARVRNIRDCSGKMGIALDLKRHAGGVVHRLSGSRVADQSAFHRSDRPGRAAKDRAVNHESLDLERRMSSR